MLVHILQKITKIYILILSKDCQKIIEKSLIPGNDDKQDVHLITLENIQNYFNIYHSGFGCYICSCGSLLLH